MGNTVKLSGTIICSYYGRQIEIRQDQFKFLFYEPAELKFSKVETEKQNFRLKIKIYFPACNFELKLRTINCEM